MTHRYYTAQEEFEKAYIASGGELDQTLTLNLVTYFLDFTIGEIIRKHGGDPRDM